jgi:hypothetical protein
MHHVGAPLLLHSPAGMFVLIVYTSQITPTTRYHLQPQIPVLTEISKWNEASHQHTLRKSMSLIIVASAYASYARSGAAIRPF